MSTTPDQHRDQPPAPANLSSVDAAAWSRGFTHGRGGWPPDADGQSYMDGYMAVSSWEANKPPQPNAAERGGVADHLALRILAIETQLSSIAGAVRQLSSRVSEIERQPRGLAAAPKSEPDQSTVQSVAASNPEFELKILAIDLNSFALRFSNTHRVQWTFADSVADSIRSISDKIESLSHNFQEPANR